jgi:CheY-like chemotaxis protein
MPTPTILFVDDEPFVLVSFRQVFRGAPYTVLTAKNAKEALDLLAQQPVALLITDHRMPGMTGIELLREAKHLYPDVFRVLISGHVDEAEFRKATDEGDVQRMVYKPWDVEELQEMVREILKACGAFQDRE